MAINNIQNISFEIFRAWKENANKAYPNNKIQILDESELISDLEHSINEGIKSLLQEEKKSKRESLDYDYGFLIGFIQGNLNTQWVNEYITKKADTYKELILFKSIYEYLKIDELSLIKINRIYEEMMLINFDDIKY